MATVYSTALLRLGPQGAGTQNHDLTGGDSVAVIRDIRATNSGGSGAPIEGFVLADSLTAPLWSVLQPNIRTGVTYEWHGHQAMHPGDDLYLYLYDPGWSFRISGYSLSLP